MKNLAWLLMFMTIPLFSQQKYLQGYDGVLDGKTFGYHSPLPDVNTSLLVRARTDYGSIRWKTENIPEEFKQDTASFIWMFAMDVVSEPATFILTVDQTERIRFTSSRESTTGLREFKGASGERLLLNTTMLDRYNDQMGFAVLKVPLSQSMRGRPLLLEVSAVSQGSDTWFMTYLTGVREEVRVYQNKVVARSPEGPMHSVSIDVLHLGDPTQMDIEVGKARLRSLVLPGYNKMEVLVPKAERKKMITALTTKDGQPALKTRFVLEPVREWEIFLVQHTHTDVGYTRPQTEILPEHVRYIDQALDYCDATDDFPDDARFRWTIENTWAVREYFKRRPPEQVQRLLDRIREGRIEATGMFFNFSEIIDENTLAAQTKVMKSLTDAGIDVTTIMQNDVNGIAWCMVDFLEDTEVKYLTMGLHAHRARRPFDKPTSFWWVSPAGNRVLAYRSEHYQHGNSLALTTGQMDVFRSNLSGYLASLEKRQYPFEKISLQFSGYVTDNSPPSPKACDIIREWNEKYEWPRLRSALAREFMMYLEDEHMDDIPEKEVAWPDWWTDGVGSAANEARELRNIQVEMANISGLLAMGKVFGANVPPDITRQMEEIHDGLLFYSEHTYGSAESVRDPRALNSVNQWNMKASYIWDAAKRSSMLMESALAFLEPSITSPEGNSIAVFNTLNWSRSGMVYQFIDNEVIPEGSHFRVVDDLGRVVPFQRYESRPEGSYYGFWVSDMPPWGYRSFKIEPMDDPEILPDDPLESMENDHYRVDIDPKRGVITGLFDKELMKPLLDPQDTLTLGQVIYEELEERHSLERLTNDTRDTVYRPLQVTRTLLKNVRIINRQDGAVYNSVFLAGDLPGCTDPRGITVEIRLYHLEKKIELLYSMWKLPVFEPEGVYVAFPFQLDGGEIAFEAQGGVVYPGRNQLEGSSSDWNTVQAFASVRNRDMQVVLGTKDVPLVQFGDLNIGRYYYRLHPKTNHIYSWVMNNYWVTNFKASQEGEFRWQYSITSGNDTSNGYATRKGWSDKTPLVSRVIRSKDGTGTAPFASSLPAVEVPGLLLVGSGLSLDLEDVIFHFREVDGKHAILDIDSLLKQTGAKAAFEVSVLEENLSRIEGSLEFDHFESKFIRLDF